MEQVLLLTFPLLLIYLKDSNTSVVLGNVLWQRESAIVTDCCPNLAPCEWGLERILIDILTPYEPSQLHLCHCCRHFILQLHSKYHLVLVHDNLWHSKVIYTMVNHESNTIVCSNPALDVYE